MPAARTLTREVIVDAALGYADAHDLESLSTRRLATDLGVTPMALYRHVRNKAEILDAVVDELLTRLGLPDRPTTDWRAWLLALAGSLRQLFVQQPIAVAVFARGPVTTPAARARLDAAVEVLRAAGFGYHDAVRAYAAVHTYTVGFCTLEASRRAASETTTDVTEPADDASALIGRFISDQQFTYGLQALLTGLTPTDAESDQSAG